ncbi:hypothetical protein [Massilia sp. Se16.2.3]|uniref:hypothetical protein n=1 Tax=Massilia sp. Se16.2.3 TaxID=2709303 RepID=UPI001602BA21|nr:hypothetical protein [Massilia sp. Se16.2.3]QNA98999.1 hypothetical protein G4G31_09290 [Massilia sp. Se16.2.3]
MSFRHACPGIAGALFLLTAMAAPADPFRDHDGQLPPPSQYSGPSFRLSHAYPSGLPAPRMPWRTAIGNVPISTGNAAAYTQALKDSIARDMVALLANDGDWDAGSRGWYHDPWLGSQREAIHGMLVGLEQVDNALFPKSGLAKPFTTYVVTYYNRIGAQTLGRIWRDPQAPQLGGGATQYADGSVTVKLAFTTAGPQAWPAMRGALSWPIMMAANATTGHFGRPTPAPAYLMQADIVVKDSQSAPQTGWVFTTRSTTATPVRAAAGSGTRWCRWARSGATIRRSTARPMPARRSLKPGSTRRRPCTRSRRWAGAGACRGRTITASTTSRWQPRASGP